MKQIQLETIMLSPADRELAKRALSGLANQSGHAVFKAALTTMISNQRGQLTPLKDLFSI